MNIEEFYKNENEKPLDRLVTNGGMCSIFRTVGCIGDSLSSGELQGLELGVERYFDYFDISWGQFMARDAGIKVHNFSKGGMTARKYINSYADEKGWFDNSLACQAYIIALGVNDVSQMLNGEIEMGDIDSINVKDYGNNKPDFAGYYAAIISKYKEIQPHAKFFLMTMPKATTDSKERTALYDKHAELLRKMAELFSNCFVIDFRKYAPVYDEKFQEVFFLGGHLNSQGYRLTGTMVQSYIDYLIRNNPEKFKQAGFIGKVHYFAGN